MITSNKKTLFIILAIALVFIGRYWYLSPKFNAGENIPSFSAPLADGTAFELSSLQGKHILLQFWGSWCGPCRRENPELVSLYRDLHKSGLEIVSVGLENNAGSWQKAIASDGLNWPYHILQQGSFDSELAKFYGVRQIPTLYLLGKNLEVVLSNPSPTEVRKYIIDHPL